MSDLYINNSNIYQQDPTVTCNNLLLDTERQHAERNTYKTVAS